MDRLLRQVSRHERAMVVLGLLLVEGAAWAYLWSGAGTLEDMGGMLMPMSSGPWTPAHALVMLAMWWVMMVAMMLPSAMPVILVHASIAGRQPRAGWVTAAFTAGYLMVWGGFGVAATALQFALERLALLSPMMELSSVALAAATFVAAGLYQWTPLKRTCLEHCHSPLAFVMTHWRDGPRGALWMGWRHGIYCLGCCWVLMLLLFVGGLMNLVWIAALALYVLAEKLLPGQPWVRRVAGGGLLLWGLALLWWPGFA